MSKIVFTVNVEGEVANLVDRERMAAHVAAQFVADGIQVKGVRAHADNASPGSNPQGPDGPIDGFFPART